MLTSVDFRIYGWKSCTLHTSIRTADGLQQRPGKCATSAGFRVAAVQLDSVSIAAHLWRCDVVILGGNHA